MTSPPPPSPSCGEVELSCDLGPSMESEIHLSQRRLTIESLRLHLDGIHRPDILVAGNTAIYFSKRQVRQNESLCPDIFVVFDTVQRPRESWVVWKEGAMPDIVIELLSESTEHSDRGDKMQIYARALRVGEYYLFDPHDGRLEGYRLAPEEQRYVRMAPDERGDLPCNQLGLRLGVRPGLLSGEIVPRLRWITPEGEVLPTPAELAQAAGRLAGGPRRSFGKPTSSASGQRPQRRAHGCWQSVVGRRPSRDSRRVRLRAE